MNLLTKRNFPSLLEEFFGDGDVQRAPAEGHYSPNVEVRKSESAYTVIAHVPGAVRENVEVEAKNGYLHIRGKVAAAEEGESKTVYSELPRYTEFKRSLRIDDRSFDLDRVEARIENGVLTVSLPVAEAAKPKKIAVN